MKRILSAFILSLIFLSAVSCKEKQTKLPAKDLTITRSDGTTVIVNAEIAKTPETREHGFMERKTIPDNTGMIFIFEQDQILSFWMKNTPTPLSIAFIDYSGKIRDIFDMKPFSLDTIVSTVSVRYALEVPKGWFAKNNIKPGDMVELLKDW